MLYKTLKESSKSNISSIFYRNPPRLFHGNFVDNLAPKKLLDFCENCTEHEFTYALPTISRHLRQVHYDPPRHSELSTVGVLPGLGPRSASKM